MVMIEPADKLLAEVIVTLPEPASATAVIAEAATVIVMLLLADPPEPEHVTVYEVVAVRLPVEKEPEVLVPPVPEEEVHEVLLEDVQLTVVLVLYAIEVETAVTVTVGRLAALTVIVMLLLVVPPAPVQLTV